MTGAESRALKIAREVVQGIINTQYPGERVWVQNSVVGSIAEAMEKYASARVAEMVEEAARVAYETVLKDGYAREVGLEKMVVRAIRALKPSTDAR